MPSYSLNAKVTWTVGDVVGMAFGPKPVGGGPEGTGMEWRITIVSSLTERP